MANDADHRPDPPTRADERTTLLAFLGFQRATLEWKCAGLDAADLARRGVPPSAMSLLGIVRHMAEVERIWFRRVMQDGDPPPHYYSDSDPDGDFDGAEPDPAVVADAFATWEAEIAAADAFVVAAEDLDVVGTDPKYPDRGAISLRWVLVHMIEEYARHNGHADLLREQIDGAVGE